MLSALYNLLWYPALPFALLAAHPANMRDYRERMGRGDFPETAGAPRIWIHAASVGEIEAIRPVAIGLLERYPGAVMAITTMTAAGREAARRRIPGATAWMLAPLDNRRAVRSFLERVRPNLVLITETEIWPNYFIESARAGATIAVVNGRISERSMRRYMRARACFDDALGRATLIMTQSRRRRARATRSSISPAKIVVTGNTKIEAAKADVATEDPIRPELLAFASGRKIFIAGSTAPGEEAVIANAYRELRKEFPQLALTIAPRHLERTPEVENALRAASLDYVKASELNSPNAAARRRRFDPRHDGRAAQLLSSRRDRVRRRQPRAGTRRAKSGRARVGGCPGADRSVSREPAADSVVDGRCGRRANRQKRARHRPRSFEVARRRCAREQAGRNAHASVSKGAGGAQLALKHLEALINLG